jgi:hypothetical protein
MPDISTPRTAIALTASLQIDPERLARMWSLDRAERDAAARRGELSLGEMLIWAARRPHEVELVHGEFFFLAEHIADYEP